MRDFGQMIHLPAGSWTCSPSGGLSLTCFTVVLIYSKERVHGVVPAKSKGRRREHCMSLGGHGSIRAGTHPWPGICAISSVAVEMEELMGGQSSGFGAGNCVYWAAPWDLSGSLPRILSSFPGSRSSAGPVRQRTAQQVKSGKFCIKICQL